MKKTKCRYKVKRSPLDVTANFQWWYTYNNEYTTLDEAKEFLNMLADNCISQHNIERYDDYFIDHTTDTKYEILYL